ncbi:MAG: hypothetical protein JWQ03_3083 [Variovorax sp.]|nr:hypothetical protein [Variovorax sp.]
MLSALNYTTKAIEAFVSYEATSTALSKPAFRYLAGKLRQAQVFVLPDFGMILDRSKAPPEVPASIFKPPFPVVALEYQAPVGRGRHDPVYTAAPCSKRIALAWEWSDDFPHRHLIPEIRTLGEGVGIASIAYYDDPGIWLPVPAVFHLPYDAEWIDPQRTPFREHLVSSGGISKAAARSRSLAGTPVPLLLEAVAEMARTMGRAGSVDRLGADLMDEFNAYSDLCCALACKNVRAESVAAAPALNKSRIKSGKLPLKDFHILKLDGEQGSGSGSIAGADRRTHLRRGHIRRLAADRITWVNATIVHGRKAGFADKAYAIGGRA